jgi:hypothetical protein
MSLVITIDETCWDCRDYNEFEWGRVYFLRSLQQILPHPMQLAWMAFPFPYADLKSPFVPSRAKKHIFPHIRALSVRQQVYMQVAPLQPAYIGFGAQN